MPKSANQKLKLLYLSQILEQESDEAHPLSVQDLIAALGRHGISAERKSIYDDVEALRGFGMDIVTVRGRGNAYFLGERRFELPEMKLLVDAVQSSKFISENKSAALIKKICSLASRHEAVLMQRQVYVQGRGKTVNERTYYNVDTIQAAIAANRQIEYHYLEWAVDPSAPHLFRRQMRRDGALYRVSPFALLWDDEFYYLLAYDETADIIKHYRVDKMDTITLTDAPRQGHKTFKKIDIPAFSKSIFGMYGGREEDVRLRFANHLIGVVVDRFGPEIIINKSGDEHFTVTAKVTISPQFFSWLFGFGAEAQILSPQSVAAEMRKIAEGVINQYDDIAPV